ncbi:M42 family metallopeptidase [[Mycoplasma] gypis]|uniref:M42 family metallopeptidase n=1 Tax=[Mycoplasma] gypis TaxID=92404 RepID=A0ABZ2RSQ6_9BACT|nr:M42 family metallopeptidase [[Mycoplasma] gypis]MBN0919149.1 M42 family metallopeptidase [[Mycoplasma] gypis]
MTKEEFKKLLISYMEINAMSRYEEPVVNQLKNNLKNSNFSFSRDGLGSLIMFKKSSKPNAPKIMISAHMDEVGYIVRIIDKSGQLLLAPIGGIWPSVAIGTKATLVINKDNKSFTGVFGHTSIHVMTNDQVKNAMTNNQIFADFGFISEQDAHDNGVEVGDRVYMSGETINFANPDLIGGKAMDNRAGVTTLEYIAHAVNDIDLDCDLYLVGSVQEEVGTRGAKASVSLIEPNVAIALDTTTAHDTYGIIPGNTKLSAGAALRVYDRGTMMDPGLVEWLAQLSRDKNIKAYKFVAAGGGTDAAELQFGKGGVATITISLPQRYLHSPIGVCDINDLMAAGDLITEFLKELSAQSYQEKLAYK